MSSRSSSEYDSEDEIDNEQAKIANCIRNVAKFSKIKSFHIMDKGDFDPEMLNLYMKEASPKLIKLLSHIQELDAKDQQEFGHVFKHMIFTDVKSSTYGTKILASAFVANGYEPAFKTQGPGFSILPEEDLEKTKGKNFAVLMSKTLYDRPMNVRFKKAILEMFNDRVKNTYGDNIRFIILDQGFKEGIDLFDVKYVHLFEPLLVPADEKQAIGRGTRFCGQMGLEFHPRYGWPLYVYKYNVTIPADLKNKYKNASDLFELYLQYANIDLRKVNFAAELETIAREAAVDAILTEPIHKFSIQKPPARLSGGAKDPSPPSKLMNFNQMQNYITTNFMKFKYPNAKLENKCMSGGAPTCGASFDFSSCGMSGGAPARQIVSFTPTQDFVRHFFQPASAYKGMLYYHSVGTGKTCSAIATATTSFEKEGYTILWVTRHTLKSDIWKNMYSQICSLVIREQLEKNTLKLPQKIGSPMKYVSDKWMQPISYKQFSNLLLKKNKYYEEIVKRNGDKDPLKKTLLIIDEAHKLYSPTVAASEKPNTDILEKMIQNSYKKSGDESVRIILMTGTPYTEDGMEMIKLINLLKEPQYHLETNFDKFGKNYLDNQGFFTIAGSKKFKNELSGYISYVNRSQDARNFSYPVMEHIDVPISIHNKEETVENKLAKAKERLKDLKYKLKDEANFDKNAAKACALVQKQNLKNIEKELKKQKQEELDTCKQVPLANGARAACKESVNNRYIQKLEEAVQKEQQKYNTCIANIPTREQRADSPEAKEFETLQAFVNKSRDFKQGINNTVNIIRVDMKEKKRKLKELEEKLKTEKLRIRAIKDKDQKRKETKEMRDTIGKEYKTLKKAILEDHNEIVDHSLDKKKFMLEEGSKKLEDVSQVTALEKKCGINKT